MGDMGEEIPDAVKLLVFQASKETAREVMETLGQRLDDIEETVDQLWDEQQRRKGSRDLLKVITGATTALAAASLGYIFKIWFHL